MATELIMPRQGLTMEEGTLARWLVAEGDAVAQGQPVAEIETDKVTIELEAPAAGRIGRLEVAEGQTVPVTTLLALIYGADEWPAQSPSQAASLPAEPKQIPVFHAGKGRPTVPPPPRSPGRGPGEPIGSETDPRVPASPRLPLTASPASPGGSATAADVSEMAARLQETQAAQDLPSRRFSSPRARKRARELGLDPSSLSKDDRWQTLPGSGPRGRIVERDVLRAAEMSRRTEEPVPGGEAAVAPGEEAGERITWVVPTAIQRVAAEQMTASFDAAPHFYLSAQALAGELLALKERLNPLIERVAGGHLTITDLLIKIVAAALAEHPRANAFWRDGRIGLHSRVGVGIAVATGQGLVVPVIRDADGKRLAEIALARAGLVERARTGKLALDDLAGGTFTLSNLGMYRVDAFQAILNPPQSALLAVGRIVERPVVRSGQLGVAPVAVLSLSCDHRVLDGALGAQFLSRVVELIEEPYALLA